MKTRYKYIHFEKEPTAGYDIWYCQNNRSNDMLGWATFEDQWKQYVFSAKDADIIFSASCLDDISHFLKQLNKETVCQAN